MFEHVENHQDFQVEQANHSKKVFNKLRGFPCARSVGGVRGTWVLLSVCPAAPIKGRIIANGKLQSLQSLNKKEKVGI